MYIVPFGFQYRFARSIDSNRAALGGIPDLADNMRNPVSVPVTSRTGMFLLLPAETPNTRHKGTPVLLDRKRI